MKKWKHRLIQSGRFNLSKTNAMMKLLTPKRQNQNAMILGKSIGKRPFNFGLPKILIQTGGKSKCRAKTNHLCVACRSIFVSVLWVWILQNAVMLSKHLALRKGTLYV